jgi:uncharacterized protein YciI
MLGRLTNIRSLAPSDGTHSHDLWHVCCISAVEKRAATTLIYSVLVDDIAQFAELRAKYGDARNEFLMALRRQRRLLLEGTLGERGCLMLIEAESVEDVLAVLQSDPYVVEPIPSKVLIRSLEINVLGNTQLLFRGKTWRKRLELFR